MQRASNIYLVFIALLICESIAAQSNVLVSHFSRSDYRAGNQNWDIATDLKGSVYVANNSGLLAFNSASWNLHQLPGKTLIRSVACDNGKIYTGSFEEFGYWSINSESEWEYNSLIPQLKDYTLHNDEIWKIVTHDNKIYFQSFGAIFMYDNETIKPLKVPGLVLFLLQADGHLFVQQINGGLFELIGTEFIPLPGSNIFNDTEVKAVISLNNKDLLIGTSSRGIFKFDGVTFSEWDNDVADELRESKINNGIALADKLVFGTILNGIYILDKNGRLMHHLNSTTSLQNNTILSLESDRDDNLWVGMDKGIDYIAFDSPIDLYHETWTSYNACIFQGDLYIATNQGLYYYPVNSDGTLAEKHFINRSQGQVWFVRKIDNELYCGLNDGTYKIENHRLKQISSVSGGYNLSKVIYQEKEFLIQSTYSSIVVYTRVKGSWVMSHTLDGFMAPAKYLETDFVGDLWLGHSIKGIYLIHPAGELDSIAQVKKIGAAEGLPESANRVFKVDNKLVIPTGERLYRWNDVSGTMIPYDELNSQLEGFETANSIIQIPGSKYWFIKKDECGMFDVRSGKARLLYRIIPEMYSLNLVENYENIVPLNDSLNLICLDNGFALLDIYRLNQLKEINKPPLFREIIFIKNSTRHKKVSAAADQKTSVINSHNNLIISFSTDEPAGKRKYYQYELEGLDEGWSEWSSDSQVSYTRLPAGNYTFRVRSLNSKGIVTQPAKLVFRIRPPWYLSVVAYIAYSTSIICAIILLRLFYRRRLHRHKELLIIREQEKTRLHKEQAEKEIIRLSHENLEAEVAHKNSQLANSTISIIKKNELLIEIDNELENLKSELGYRMPNKYYDKLKKLINQNIENEHDWEMFEHLFDQAHENFFRRLKTEYPTLTPSDLRLCAYLRMNLSSKEIAPLINITTRGVEERRYRLRKRLNLPPESNLTDYILSY